ncbi:hypothetical protein [Streptomyces sp. NBC_01565]|uniref:hypothetical protein n=1 Tax=unclassified Streptomyces TaxID=2593676 RepID=UPI00224F4254|nr:hypothetical protein [Streptomyces sp. NBC_01565]MCX4546861.1 hypothetical protein [Streptomyces sp. NBC_01565]
MSFDAPQPQPQPQPLAQPQPQPEIRLQRPPAGSPGADPVVLMLLAFVVAGILGATVYVVAVHPRLANPVIAAATVAAPLVAVLIAVYLRRR